MSNMLLNKFKQNYVLILSKFNIKSTYIQIFKISGSLKRCRHKKGSLNLINEP